MEDNGTFTPVQSARLYDQIVEQIESRIASGSIGVGDRLPSERDMAAQFGVSRAVVREAAKALQQKGLVEIRFGSGVFVADNSADVARESLDLMIRMGREDAFSELVEARELLERLIAQLAAIRRTEEHVDTLQCTVEALEASRSDTQAAVTADLEFHQTIARASGNRYLAMLLNTINESLHDARFRYFSIEGALDDSLADHKAILSLVRDRDSERCSQTMGQHVRKMRRVFDENTT